jgi:lysozyme family protein
MVDLVALRKRNALQWAQARLTRPADFNPVAVRLLAHKATYIECSEATAAAAPGSIPVPWWFIAVVHEREASQRFDRSIAQGDRWDRVSINVPAGRGPFTNFEEAAVDALLRCAPKAALNRDWSIGTALTLLEGYNGYGYAMRSLPSPYVWSGTDQYTSGKFVADHVFDPTKVDAQLGCAGLIMALMKLDPSIAFGSATLPATPAVAVLPSPAAPKSPSKASTAPVAAAAPASTGIAGALASLFSSIFKKSA